MHKLSSLSQALTFINDKAVQQKPFFMLIDFEIEEMLGFEGPAFDGVHFQFGVHETVQPSAPVLVFEKFPPPFEQYKAAFDLVHGHLSRGDSFLTNLAIKSRVDSNWSLADFYHQAKAKYKVLLPGRFTSFSPETFIRIEKGEIATFPMKGTIDASLPDAEARVLADPKEAAEHATIVDLLRNDLSRYAERVEVRRFRYVEKIYTAHKHLLQVSSEIVGQLEEGYEKQLGEIIFSMLPAGSISGAPKPKTCEIIGEAEKSTRGFYTGVALYFDGSKLDSCVLIRYLEQVGSQLFYRSGGGITFQSEAEKEYLEAIDKIYVPITGIHTPFESSSAKA